MDPTGILKPTVPTMGDLVQSSRDEWNAWTGGKPKSSWVGLEDSSATYESPNQLRSTYPSSAQKGYNYRKKGLETKFSKQDDLALFQKQVLKHLVDCGMDSIAHLEDPADSSIMSNVIKEYARFTLSIAQTALAHQSILYDKYDRENDRAAVEFLLDSLDADLSRKLHERLEETSNFPVVWIHLLKLVQSTSIERFENLRTRIKNRQAANYSGEDIELLAVDFRRDALELATAGQYEHNLTLSMLKIFLIAGGANNGNYQFPLRLLKKELNEALLVIPHMSRADANKFMVKAGLTYKDICTLAEDEYRSQFDLDEWPPARTVKDSKAVPPAFANLTEARVLTLIHQASTGSSENRPKGACHGCGSLDHWKRDCPNNQDKGKSNRNVSWKTTPPPADAKPSSIVNDKPVHKQVHNGTEFCWCDSCNRWSTTHHSGTHGHKAVETTAAAHIAFSGPAAWHVSLSWDVLLCDLLDILGPHLVGFLFGALAVGFLKFGTPFFAPLLWASVLGYFFWSLPAVTNHHDGQHRKNRQPRKNCHRRRPGSIRDHGLHRQYPRKHRSNGHYYVKAPTTDDRNVHSRIQRLQSLVFRLAADVHRLQMPNPASPANTGRKGGSNGHRRRNKQKVKYQPVPATGHNGFGNNNCTDHQRNSAHKIAAHCFMTQVSLGHIPPINPAQLRLAYQHPAGLQAALGKEDSYEIIWDSGASMCISYDKDDFVGNMKKVSTVSWLKGIVKGLKIQGQGHVLWAFHDTKGQLRSLKIPAYYVPNCRVRLLSTTSLLQTYPDEEIICCHDRMTLTGASHDPTRGPICVFVNPSNNLPMGPAYRYNGTVQAPAAMTASISEVSAANHNLSEPEKELLRWHQRLGHLSFRRIQLLLRTGVLATSIAHKKLHTSACKITHPCRCAACQFGKQTTRVTPGIRTSIVQDKVGAIRQGHLLTGQETSVDHFVSSVKGRLFTSKGKTPDEEMFSGGCIFVDHATNHIHIEFQKRINSHETIVGKQAYESLCLDYGVIPQSYLSDNDTAFTSHAFELHLENFSQNIRFAGAGAHHHNGHAERAIRTVMSIARTMMLHAAIHWPDMADPCLWPMAVQHAVFLYNHMPSLESGLSPHDLFSKTRWEHRRFLDLHVWGCPVYVLDKTLSDGKKIPKWRPRSQRCIYVGLSKKHATSVPLVLNPVTGAITAQFHVVFDDWFSTIASSVDNLPDFNSDEWLHMFGEATFQYPFDAEDTSDEPAPLLQTQRDRTFDTLNQRLGTAPLAPPPPRVLPLPSIDPVAPTTLHPREPPPVAPRQQREPPLPQREPPLQQREPPLQQRETPTVTFESPLPQRERSRLIDALTPSLPEPPPRSSSSPRRSARQRQAPSRLGYDGSQGSGFVTEVFGAPTAHHHLERHFESYMARTDSTFQPFCLVAHKDPDTLNWGEAMADTDHQEKWVAAARAEIAVLEANNTWIEVTKSSAKSRIVPGTWVFRRKRTPDGEIKKYKARFCCRGDLMEAEESTYAPVVHWPTVRIVLTLAMLFGWVTCSIDFDSAFVQAQLKDPVWIHLPRGFRSSEGDDMCLKLEKSLYGLTIAPKLWYEHLTSAILSLGFKRSSYDPCLFYQEHIMIVVYVDDCGIAASDPKHTDALIAGLRSRGFILHVEGKFEEFLGISIDRGPDFSGPIHMTQKGLIKKVIDYTGMNDCNPNWTPASTVALGADVDSSEKHEDCFKWSYATAVGMLQYLAMNTRPDISFAVSQVSRFTHGAKKSHGVAIKTIVRYLKRTEDKGTYLDQETYHDAKCMKLECFVDADFAGLYKQDPDELPSSAKSRTGYVIRLAGAPLIWKSKLQTEISLSTLESEYSALSQAMRQLMPLRLLIIELLEAIKEDNEENLKSSISCTVFEDNNGALALATNQRITARTKYFHVKWHHFWNAVSTGDIAVVKVDTKDQLADYLTKGLPREIFEHLRKLVQGW